jgi:hypothetical protein
MLAKTTQDLSILFDIGCPRLLYGVASRELARRWRPALWYFARIQAGALPDHAVCLTTKAHSCDKRAAPI